MRTSNALKPVIAGLALLLLVGAAPAQSANLLHFQARLNDSGGVPINGPVSYTVAIYDDAALFGPSLLWSEAESGTALNGVVNALLGTTSTLPANLFDGGDRWMGISVGLDPEMTPRSQIASTGYALRAADVYGADINPNSVTINGSPVIDAGGAWVGSPTGLVGPQGPPGADGDDGADGNDGAPGAPGADGDDGAPGADGNDGAPGADGADGVDGDDGAPGATGATGPAGPNGPKLEDTGLSGWGMDVATAPQKLMATVQPTVGTVIGSAKVYGEDSSVQVELLSLNLTSGAASSLAIGTVNTAMNFADFSPGINDYLTFRMDASTPLHTVYGAHVNGSDVPVPVFTEPFPIMAPANWTFTAGVNNGTVGWAVDATPALVATGISSFQSSPFSLNYNNGTNFNAGTSVINTGAATSTVGLINLTGSASGSLTFMCAYVTETTLNTFDKRFVEFSNNGFSSTLLSAQLAGGTSQSGGINACSPATSSIGTWHAHTLPLAATGWGSVQMRYRFDTVDGTINTGTGWFVDDVVVSASGPLGPPGTPIQRVTPDQFMVNDD